MSGREQQSKSYETDELSNELQGTGDGNSERGSVRGSRRMKAVA